MIAYQTGLFEKTVLIVISTINCARLFNNDLRGIGGILTLRLEVLANPLDAQASLRRTSL